VRSIVFQRPNRLMSALEHFREQQFDLKLSVVMLAVGKFLFEDQFVKHHIVSFGRLNHSKVALFPSSAL